MAYTGIGVRWLVGRLAVGVRVNMGVAVVVDVGVAVAGGVLLL
jgi:hypothetical protein